MAEIMVRFVHVTSHNFSTMPEADDYTQSHRVRRILSEVVVCAVLRFSEDRNGIRTRSSLEREKEEAAAFVDSMFWTLRWFVRSDHILPSLEVLASVLITQDSSYPFTDTYRRLGYSFLNPQDISLGEKLLEAVVISVIEEHDS